MVPSRRVWEIAFSTDGSVSHLNYSAYNMALHPTPKLHLDGFRDFTGGPVVKNLLSNSRDASSIPGRGTKTAHVAW